MFRGEVGTIRKVLVYSFRKPDHRPEEKNTVVRAIHYRWMMEKLLSSWGVTRHQWIAKDVIFLKCRRFPLKISCSPVNLGKKKNALVGMSIAIFNLFDIAYFVGFSIKYVCHISVFKQMMS